ncbi:hypothetical protein [Sphingomonas phyllosphaerae]|uniref:hypothetical protein n=1 Tax=Sphingomonas phyllosphaerae TaxID=257003 RepID=UPI00042374E7|nr:hypothetical protein [Sphingomonas phyllosphaerae]
MPGRLLLLLAQVTTTPPPAPPEPTTLRDVIVVGHRAEKELAACLARNCPPAQEVEASLQASVEQFADARYTDALRTLQRAVGRNKRYAAQLPGPVSSLYATMATVAEHEGLDRIWRNAARHNVEVLRTHIGTTNAATLTQELQLADDLLALNMPGAAEGIYKKVAQRGRDNGQPAMAANATFRQAWVALMRGQFRNAGRLADESVAVAGPAQSAIGELRDILRMRIAVRKGDAGAIDALAARLRQSGKRSPALLYAPDIKDINPSREFNGRASSDEVQWADVGYWIRPDGRTADVELLRSNGLGPWQPSILKHVGARRYIPLDLQPTDPGLYRIDRFTVRAPFEIILGSRIPQRSGPATVHIVDLTDTDAMSEAARTRVAQATPATVPQ